MISDSERALWMTWLNIEERMRKRKISVSLANSEILSSGLEILKKVGTRNIEFIPTSEVESWGRYFHDTMNIISAQKNITSPTEFNVGCVRDLNLQTKCQYCDSDITDDAKLSMIVRRTKTGIQLGWCNPGKDIPSLVTTCKTNSNGVGKIPQSKKWYFNCTGCKRGESKLNNFIEEEKNGQISDRFILIFCKSSEHINVMRKVLPK